ncbi:hypothetical protein BGX24_001874 [Mortierella sp. AD032]|nr:hypothetical protein BGX24_001874 [Mortierella sp. AD032]
MRLSFVFIQVLHHESRPQLLSIAYLQSIPSEDPVKQDPAKIDKSNSFTVREVLEGASLHHLEAFIKSKDKYQTLGNLYRTITKNGHVKWVCIDHYRLAHGEHDQQAFTTEVELNDGRYNAHLSKATVKLRSKFRASRFFDTLAKAGRVDELDVTFDWVYTSSDQKAFGDTLKSAAVSIVRLDLQASLEGEVLSASTRYELVARIVSLSNMKMIHIVLSMDSLELSRIQSKRPSHYLKISVELMSRGKCSGSKVHKEIGILVATLKAKSTLTTLNLWGSSISYNGAVALAETLKTNSTLTTLDLGTT